MPGLPTEEQIRHGEGVATARPGWNAINIAPYFLDRDFEQPRMLPSVYSYNRPPMQGGSPGLTHPTIYKKAFVGNLPVKAPSLYRSLLYRAFPAHVPPHEDLPCIVLSPYKKPYIEVALYK